MNIDQHFNVTRFSFLLKKELFSNYRLIAITVVAVFGMLLIISMISAYTSGAAWNFHLVFYPLTLFIGGYITSSSVFYTMHQHPRNYSYLTLPCSNFEKFASMLILSSIGYVGISALFYYLFTLAEIMINQTIFGLHHPVFNIFSDSTLTCIRLYFVTQSIFLFASAYFKKYALVKIILSLNGLHFAIMLFIAVAARIIYHDYFDGFSLVPIDDIPPNGVKYDVERFFVEKFVPVIKFVFWWILAPWFWLMTYFRIKEKQV